MAKLLLTAEQFKLLGYQIEGDLRPDYSGRGMYGATCLGFVPDEEGGSSAPQMQFELAAQLAGIPPDAGPDEVIEGIRDKMAEIGAPSQDSMGLGTVYYWRGIQVEGHARASKF